MADRRETLPHDGKLFSFIIKLPKFVALPPAEKKQLGGVKTCKIWPDFRRLRILIANISETDGDVQNRKTIILELADNLAYVCL